MTAAEPGPDASELTAMLDALVRGRATVGWHPIDAALVADLSASESAAVERAVPRRQAEFATGRSLMRSLLGRDVEILRAATGAPVLPPDVVGSLAHDRDVAVGVVAEAASLRAVGIDVEPLHEIEHRVAELIVRPDDVTPDALTAFVAKEAAYKAWSVLGGEMLEHHDVNLIVESGRYWADLRGELVVNGELGRAAGRVVALVLIPAT